jgi:hypothetical protein
MDEKRLDVVVAGKADSDPAELDALTRELRRRLLELDVESVSAVRDQDVPEGAKPIDAITIGSLLVTLSPAVLQSVVSLVDTWASNRRVKSVKLTLEGDSIELTDAAPEDQQRLLELFLERHAVG